MKDIHKELIEKELGKHHPKCEFYYKKLSNKFLSWLFSRYYTLELTEHWYDSEPEIPSEWKEREESENIWKNKEFLSIYKQLCKEYENKRLQKSNWIDVYGEGIWFMSQRKVDDIAKEYLKKIRSTPISDRKERLHVAYKDEYIFIYWYGRDYQNMDIWWIMKSRKSGMRDKYEKHKNIKN